MTRRELGLLALAAVLPVPATASGAVLKPVLPAPSVVECVGFRRWVSGAWVKVSGFDVAAGDIVRLPDTLAITRVTRNDLTRMQFHTVNLDLDGLPVRERHALLNSLTEVS